MLGGMDSWGSSHICILLLDMSGLTHMSIVVLQAPRMCGNRLSNTLS